MCSCFIVVFWLSSTASFNRKSEKEAQQSEHFSRGFSFYKLDKFNEKPNKFKWKEKDEKKYKKRVCVCHSNGKVHNQRKFHNHDIKRIVLCTIVLIKRLYIYKFLFLFFRFLLLFYAIIINRSRHQMKIKFYNFFFFFFIVIFI